MPVFYDSMISKLVAWAPDRSQAIERMRRALTEYQVEGVKTTLPFFRWMLRQPAFLEGRVDTAFLDKLLANRQRDSFSTGTSEIDEHVVLAAAVHTFLTTKNSSYESSSLQDSDIWRRTARLESLR